MKRFVLFSCLLGLSVDATRVDPYLDYHQPYLHGLSSLRNPEVRSKLIKVEHEKKLEEPQIKQKVIQLHNPKVEKLEDRRNIYTDDRIGYGFGSVYGGEYQDYGLEDVRYRNDGYGVGNNLDDSKDYNRRFKGEENYGYIKYAGYGALPDMKDRRNKYDGFGYKVEFNQNDRKGKNEGNRGEKDQKDRRNKDDADQNNKGFKSEGNYRVALDGEKERYKDGYIGIGFGEGGYEKFRGSYQKGLVNIGYRDGYYNRKDDKYRDPFGLYGYGDVFGYGIGYGDEGFDKIKNERGFRDGYDLSLRPEGLDKLNEDNIFRYTYLKRINGETHYKTGLFYYPFDYQIIGSHGLGFDRRSASSYGLASPITPKALQPVGYYRFYKLEEDPKNEYIADKSFYQKELYTNGKY